MDPASLLDDAGVRIKRPNLLIGGKPLSATLNHFGLRFELGTERTLIGGYSGSTFRFQRGDSGQHHSRNSKQYSRNFQRTTYPDG
jgi:hypothetical protein